MKKSIRNLALLVSGIVIMFAFQNCGQPGSLSEANSSLSKTDSPLVADVVGEMENQVPTDQVEDDAVSDVPADDVADVDDKDCDDEKREHPGHIRHRDRDEEDDVVYNDELENVLREYSCQDNVRKVLICHYPRGNSAARHEICVGRPALRAHIRHSSDSSHIDHLGTCPAESED